MNTFKKDPTTTSDEALVLLYQHLRTGEAPSVDIARKFIEKMFYLAITYSFYNREYVRTHLQNRN